MKITNRWGLPQAFVRACENDSYDKGPANFSVTELIGPPRPPALRRLHSAELEEDCSDRVFALLGQGVHKILESSARPGIDIVEKRLFVKFGEYVVSGQIDLWETDTGILSDWKTSKAYPFTNRGGKGLKDDWIYQLNMQLELIRRTSNSLFEIKKEFQMLPNKLQIVGVIRDWDKNCLNASNKMKYMAGYPESEVATVDIPIMPREEIVAYIEGRIKAHAGADKNLPECKPSEIWGGDRCKYYCNVNKFCTQFQDSKKTGLIGAKDEV